MFEYISPCYLIFRWVCRSVKSHHSLRHVCPSEWNNWATTGRIFIKFDVLTIFKNSVVEIQVTLFQPSSRKTRRQNRQTRELASRSLTTNHCPCHSLYNCLPKCSWHYSWTAWPLKRGHIGCPETSVTTNLSCVTSQKSEDFIDSAEEAWNQPRETPLYSINCSDFCCWNSCQACSIWNSSQACSILIPYLWKHQF